MEVNVLKKLLKVQSQLKAPKNQRNTFGNYNYRNCEDILEAVKPLLNDVQAVIVLSDNIEMIGDRYYVKATARFIDIESGEEVSNNAFAREEEVKKGMDGSQITGASSSYARKYALNGLLDIDDTKDSDTTNEKTRTNSNVSSVSKEVEDELRKLGGTLEVVAIMYKCNVADLTDDAVKNVIEAKKKNLDKSKTENI